MGASEGARKKLLVKKPNQREKPQSLLPRTPQKSTKREQKQSLLIKNKQTVDPDNHTKWEEDSGPYIELARMY